MIYVLYTCTCTVVSRASIHSQGSVHVLHFDLGINVAATIQMYACMQFMCTHESQRYTCISMYIYTCTIYLSTRIYIIGLYVLVSCVSVNSVTLLHLEWCVPQTQLYIYWFLVMQSRQVCIILHWLHYFNPIPCTYIFVL